MKRLLVGLLMLSCFLGGCSTKWCHTSKGSSEFERDKRRCMNDSAAFANNMGAQGNIFMLVSETQGCLEKEYGWYKCQETTETTKETKRHRTLDADEKEWAEKYGL